MLFLEVALIRWMPAYIRLLAYFSNFILLASFLGIGAGLLAPSRRRCCSGFRSCGRSSSPPSTFRLEVAVSASGSIYLGGGWPQVVVESTMLLPLVFIIVAALFATASAWSERRRRRCRAPSAPNLLGDAAGVGLFAVISWQQLSPAWWFRRIRRRPLLFSPEPDAPAARGGGLVAIVNVALLAAALVLDEGDGVRCGRRAAKSRWRRKVRTPSSRVNNIFHQSMAPVDHQLLYSGRTAVFGA